jgi:iron complex transport system substrate-binding protein
MSITGWAVLALVFFGCTKKPESDAVTPNPTKGEHAPMRIISMAPNLTEILFELGVGDEIVGVTKFSTYPPETSEITNVGTFWQPDIEAVLMCRPTLIITLGFSQQSALAGQLEQIGCKTLTVNIESIDELFTAIGIIGDELNRTEQAGQLIQRLRKQQNTMTDQFAGRSDLPKVLWVVQREPLCIAGTDTFINDMIEIAGGVNAIGSTMNQYPRISAEEVLRSSPDVIIEPVMDPEQADSQRATAIEFYRRYAAIPAVQNERIHVIDGDVVSRLGPRMDQALMKISQCIWEQ